MVTVQQHRICVVISLNRRTSTLRRLLSGNYGMVVLTISGLEVARYK